MSPLSLFNQVVAQTAEKKSALRNQFAASALQGFCANSSIFAPNDRCGWCLVNCTNEALAEYCYALADAMLIAGKKGAE